MTSRKSKQQQVEKRLRFNFAHIRKNKIRQTAQGGIVVEGAVIRTGVFVYQTEDGGVVREYLPASELFRKASMDTLKGAPVTNEHPDEMISPENFRGNAIGFVDNIRNENNKFLVADIYINDAEAIRQIMEDNKRELSAGYFTDPIPSKGKSPEGEEFDVIQRNLIFNHCSIVEMGRAGPDVSLRLNSMGNQLPKGEVRRLANSNLFNDNNKKKNEYKGRKNIIREEEGEFCLYSEDGDRSFGCYETREEAEERLRQIHAFAENEMAKQKKNVTDEVKEEKENQAGAAALMEVAEGLSEASGLSLEELAERMIDLQETLIELLSEQDPSEESVEEEVENEMDDKKRKASAQSKDSRENTKKEQRLFEEKVAEEVDTRLTLLVAAKQLGVKDLSPSIPKEELALRIVQTTKPHMNLEGRSEEFKQALLEDSLSSIDIDSFWVTPEKDDDVVDDVESLGADASGPEEDDELDKLDTELEANFKAEEQKQEQQASTLNSLLSTLRVGKMNTKHDSDFDSAEERARRLMKYSNKKLIS